MQTKYYKTIKRGIRLVHITNKDKTYTL